MVKELFSPAFSDNTISYMCAISLGDDISEDEYKGRFRPINVHLPFFLGCYHEYVAQYQILKADVEDSNWQLEKEKRQALNAAEKENKKFSFLKCMRFINARREAARLPKNLLMKIII
ncbi:hypothetical protein DXC08_12975 [Clostridium sp. OM07-9AC]|nr:hypothetical protein DXC08_12975 [Clostridium sp. OM07-9AC]